ncbi:MAG: SDR family NAD(P)-dependent oxidoreductase [Gammaproteobacteria bacterium]|nr:SDR family NAD(P)-dependent oxidoreductase [Gammaproteobacteria bacterium]
MKDLQGKVAVVTGASEGIGKGIAGALAKAGAKVAILARSQDKLDATATELVGEVKGFSANLMDADDVRRVLADVVTYFGEIDILVNNVGGGTFKPLHMQTAAEADLPVGIPLTAAVAASHAVVPSMVDRRQGHIVTLTSPAGYVPFPYMMPYAATRHAMVGLALSLHDELKEHNVGSTLFCPAQVNTGYFDRNDADMGWYPRVSGVFPVLEPDDVGEQVVKSIKANKREVIYPLSLNLFLRTYQKMPRLSVLFLKLFGVWRPNPTR